MQFRCFLLSKNYHCSIKKYFRTWCVQKTNEKEDWKSQWAWFRSKNKSKNCSKIGSIVWRIDEKNSKIKIYNWSFDKKRSKDTTYSWLWHDWITLSKQARCRYLTLHAFSYLQQMFHKSKAFVFNHSLSCLFSSMECSKVRLEDQYCLKCVILWIKIT